MQIFVIFSRKYELYIDFRFYFVSLQPNFILNNGNYDTGVSSTEFL